MIDELAKHYRDIFELLGYDLDDPHIKDSPERIAKYLAEWHTKGDEPPKVTTFPTEEYNGTVFQEEIPFHSLCAHHGLTFYGSVAWGYLPGSKLLGLSKPARIVDHFANRYTVQERLTHQVANYLEETLDPLGLGVIVRGVHLCMESRGVRKNGVWTTTTILRGTFKDDPAARAEFLTRVNR